MFGWGFAAGQATGFLCLLSIWGYSALKTCPWMTYRASFTWGWGKNNLKWVLTNAGAHQSEHPCFVHTSLHCLASLRMCIPSYSVLGVALTNRKLPLETDSKDSSSSGKTMIRGFTRIRNGRVIRGSLDPIGRWCLAVLLHTFFVGYILRAKRTKTNTWQMYCQ